MSALNPLHAYKETTIKTASQGKLVIMLYDEAIKQIDKATELLGKNSKKMDNVNGAIIRAQDVITELMVSLNFDKGGDIARNLFSLYMFFNQQLLQANIKKDTAFLVPVRKMMMELRETWIEVVQKEGSRNAAPSASGVNIAG